MIHLGLGNYYGSVVAVERDGIYYLELDNYDGTDRVEITEEHYRLILREFG